MRSQERKVVEKVGKLLAASRAASAGLTINLLLEADQRGARSAGLWPGLRPPVLGTRKTKARLVKEIKDAEEPLSPWRRT